MRVFITGGSGFIGSAIINELIHGGHQVLALARSDASAEALVRAGVEVHRGDLEDLDSLREGVRLAEGVIHAGFIHDFSRYTQACEIDRRAIEALGSALGPEQPLVVTSGAAIAAGTDRPATEEDVSSRGSSEVPRVATEEATAALVAQGARVSVVRLPPSVHGVGDHGFVPMLISIARDQGVSAYIGEGDNRWCAVHRLDAAVAFRLALERAPSGARLHAVAEPEIPLRKLATMIGARLGLSVVSLDPEQAAAHFDWFARFAQLDMAVSSELTRERYGWRPTHPSLFADLEGPGYFGGEDPVVRTI
ncbi:SDR family oxidoreductase [Enhygromyxa salina]|uniref:NAD dependent epimerase/dehydratase family protein n=1 Tax=Enhygromyxa salina TaxID=215803 RepID=A0A2S9YUS5_9BACT|nr:SDR family oxidoreductase [Enhygromyxa salina]PRQ08830.1 NAD dependent epimerase/dehydratase family protein [Enhygromyxa salina]